MNKKLTNNRMKLLVGLLLLFALSVGLFLKLDGSDTVKRIYYGHVVRQAYHREYNNLKPALEGLGLTENKTINSVCKIEEIATDGVNVSKKLWCGLQTDKYVEITESNQQTILEAAKSLDDLTEKHGGRMQTNIDATFSKYITDIADGVDYNPDFGATFVRGDYLCAVHMNIAFSKPKPPAYSIQFGCNSPRVTQDDIYLMSSNSRS